MIVKRPFDDEAGAVAGVVLVARDVSEFGRAEAAVRSAEDKYRLLFENTTDSVVIADVEGRVLEVNPACLRMYGYSADEVRQMNLTDIVAPENRDKAIAAMADLAAGKPVARTIRMVRKDGARLVVDLLAYVGSIAGERRIFSFTRDVTARELAAEATVASERKYRAIFESANDAVLVETVDGQILEANENACRLLGYSRDELFKLRVRDLVPVQTRAWLPRVSDALLRERSFRAEAVYVHRGGREIPVELSASVMELGDRTLVLAIVRDVSERKHAQAALAESEERYRGLFNNSPLGIYRTTPDGRILAANPSLVAMLGYNTFAELAARNLEAGGYDADYPRARFKEMVEGSGEIRGLEGVWHRRDGSEVYVRENARCIRDERGKVLYYEGTVEDITEHRLADAALAASEAKYRILVEGIRDGVYELDQDGRFTEVNDVIVRRSGRPREWWIGRDEVSIVRPEDRERLRQTFAAVMRGESVPPYEVAYPTATGELLYIEMNSAPIYEEGRITGVMGVSRDVSRRKAAEKRMQESEEQYRRLIEMSPDGIAVHQAGRLVLVNPAGARTLGYDRPDELIGKPVLDFVHPDDRARVLERIKTVMEQGRPGPLLDERFRRKDGTYIPVQVLNAPFYWQGKPAVQVIVRTRNP